MHAPVVFEILWDEAKPFTALYLRLSGVLDALGYPDEAFCGKEALLPRETSIIDVETLRGLGETEGADSLELVTKDGRRVAAGRSEIAALTAELAITMRHKPDDFFEHTDLLDFPGYRSRLKTDDVARELAKPDQIRQFFLRGKVAYLFERYKTDLELTSMLLCIGPSNQEVQDLPAVINDWVSDAAGKTPELRQGRHTTLFLVLTKFDMEFEKKKGAVDDETRWSNRLHASLLDFFGKQHDWPEQWTPDQPFNNTYWLRNPKFRWEAVIAFDGDRETGIRPEQEAYVSDMKAKFLNTPEVRRHFADPEAAWNAAFTLNDGGTWNCTDNFRCYSGGSCLIISYLGGRSSWLDTTRIEISWQFVQGNAVIAVVGFFQLCCIVILARHQMITIPRTEVKPSGIFDRKVLN